MSAIQAVSLWRNSACCELVLCLLHAEGSTVRCHEQPAMVEHLMLPDILLQTNLGSMMSVMANMQGLRHLELEGNIGISGPLADSSPSTSSGLCSVIQVCNAFLQ